MQNRYFGDVGDYGKYGLLRKLCGITAEGPELSLGVVWYLVPDEGHNDDGKHISYLQKPEYCQCDPDLFNGLKSLLSGGRRSVAKIQQSRLLPKRTAFFDVFLSFNGMSITGIDGRNARLELRQSWLSRAQKAVKDCDLIFLDPDNGLEVKSVKRHANKGPKYIFWDDVGGFLDESRTLVIYHHLNRTMTSRNQIEIKLREFREKVPGRENVIPVLFKRGSHRVFFVLPAKTHARLIKSRLKEMRKSEWGQHIEINYI